MSPFTGWIWRDRADIYRYDPRARDIRWRTRGNVRQLWRTTQRSEDPWRKQRGGPTQEVSKTRTRTRTAFQSKTNRPLPNRSSLEGVGVHKVWGRGSPSEQVWTGVGCPQSEQVWTGLGEGITSVHVVGKGDLSYGTTPSPPVNRQTNWQTDTNENITFPQTT